LPKGIPLNYTKALVNDPYRLRAPRERRNVMPKQQGLPNNFTAGAAGGAKDDNFHLAFPR